jgi:hypothetical protein
MTPFLAIHAKGGESIKPKAKGPAPPPNFKMIFNWKFQIGISLCSKGGETSISKPLLKTKSRISLRGSFV